jgi:uncharacterized RDD family membrane protein YckC
MTQPPEPNIQPPTAGDPPPADGYTPPGPGYAYEQPPPADPYATPLPPPAGGYGFQQPAAVVATGMYVDPVSGLMLPQGTELASVGRRIGAYFLAFPLAVVTLGIGYLIWGLIVWGKGQTPALQVLGMRCWRPEEGRVAGFWWMALREVVGRLAESIFWVITSLVSFILMLTRPDRRTLHDLIAGTVVLYDPNKTLAP